MALCSYQSSLPYFLPSQPTPELGAYTQAELDEALETMCAALPAAQSSALPAASRMPNGRALACLSLGPYGAQLQPGQEYAGAYPPPFGLGPSPSRPGFSDAAAQACPLPLDDVKQSNLADDQTRTAEEDALAAFHLQRLRHFASARSGWDQLGMIAIETIPVVREARAARRAVTVLTRDHSPKPFILSFVFPLDKELQTPLCPDPESKQSGIQSLADQAERIVAACFDGPDARPAGLGINCTNPSELEPIIKALSDAVGRRNLRGDQKPWIVLCERIWTVVELLFPSSC